MAPLLSVVIPTFNRCEMVTTCVEGVLSMSPPGTQVIVVDDGSTDRTTEVLAKFGSDIRYVWQENAGPSAARNLGASLSSGEYLTFLDSDDHWIPGGPEALLDVLETHRQVPAVFGDALFGNETEGYRSFVSFYGGDDFQTCLGEQLAKDVWWCSQWTFLRRMLIRNVVFPGSLFWRRTVFESLGGFNPAIRFAEDWDLSLRLVASTNLAFYSGGPTSIYNWHEGARLTSESEAMTAGYIAVLESVLIRVNVPIVERKAIENTLGQHYAHRAHGEFMSGDLKTARRYYAEWLRRFGFDKKVASRWLASYGSRPLVERLRKARRILARGADE